MFQQLFILAVFVFELLKMLGLYLYTLIIDYKSCNMFNILNKFTLQNFVMNNLFWDKEVKAQQQQQQQQQQHKKIKHKTLAGTGNCTRKLSHPTRMSYLCTTELTEHAPFRKISSSAQCGRYALIL